MLYRTSFLALAAFLATACSAQSDSAVGAAPYCEETRTPLFDESTPTELGFSVNDVVTWGAGAFDGTLTWGAESLGPPTAVQVITTVAGTPEWVASEAVYPESGGAQLDIAVVCTPRVEVPVTVSIVTEDGRLAETLDHALSGTLAADAPGSAAATISVAQIAGTLDVATLAPAPDFDEMTAEMAYVATGDGVSVGTLSAGFSYVETCDETEDCTASYTSAEVASWTTSPPE